MPRHIAEGVASTQLTSSFISGTSGTFQTLTVAGKSLDAAYGGLFIGGRYAASGGVGDPTMQCTSGVFIAISSSLTSSISDPRGFISSSVQDGRIYINADGVYFFNCDTSVEMTSNNSSIHLSVHVTGVEHPQYSQANDMTNNNTQEISFTGIGYLLSGSYIDVRLRTSVTNTVTVHHFNFLTFRMRS